MTNDRLEVFGLGATGVRKIDLVMMPTFGGARHIERIAFAGNKIVEQRDRGGFFVVTSEVHDLRAKPLVYGHQFGA